VLLPKIYFLVDYIILYHLRGNYPIFSNLYGLSGHKSILTFSTVKIILYHVFKKHIKTFIWTLVIVLILLLSGISSYFFYKKGLNEGFSDGMKLQKSYAQSESQTRQAEADKKTATQNQVVDDIVLIGGKYNKLYSLCEQKYQYGLSGNFDSAMEVKGEMKAIEDEIGSISSKYGVTNKSQDTILQ
jgi:hypothetical protein